jgi:hypothetical protein
VLDATANAMTFIKRVMVLGVLLLATAVPLTTHAQSSAITILQNEIAPDFPETIVFRTTVESAAEIERIVLRYGTDGRSCQTGGSLQNVTFEAGNRVEAEWEWELRRSGAIPPGVTIWWQWEVEDAAGSTTISERQEHVLADESHRWQTLSMDGVTVSWYMGNAAFGQAMLEQTGRSLAHLQDDLGLPQPETVQLWFYDSATAVKDAIVNVPEWTGGVAFPEYGITVLGVAPGQEAWAADIVPHELTHLLEGILTFNCRGIRLPTWLVEGLARYAEGETDAAEVDRMLDAMAAGSLPPLKSLAAGFSAYSDGAGQAYTQSGQVVAYLIGLHGPEKMTELLQTMQQGQDVDAALTAVYGFDTAGLDALWRTSVGYAPTPTSAADAAALAGTATAVPTIALGGIPQSAPDVPDPLATQPPTAAPTAVPTPTEFPTTTPQPVAQNPPDTATPVATTDIPEEKTGNSWLWPVGGLLLVAVAVFIVLNFQKGRG